MLVVDVKDNEITGDLHGEHINIPDSSNALGLRSGLADTPEFDNASWLLMIHVFQLHAYNHYESS